MLLKLNRMSSRLLSDRLWVRLPPEAPSKECLCVLVLGMSARDTIVEAVRQAMVERTADYKSDGERFHDALAEQWRSVGFNEKTRTGWAQAGSLGRITFQESGNDPAVIVEIPKIRVKADSESMVEFLDKLHALINSV